MSALPELPLTYYGDDFTGSTDVMEALTRSGVSTRLFLDPPERRPALGAFGIAGTSRCKPPAWMDRELPEVFAALAASRAPILHYKVCSTFDSAPHLGSIGRALEIGRRITGPAWVPLVVGAPVLGRYCAFGNLFARSGLESEVFRLDRHPTMSRHPSTPMAESDLRLVLGEQTDLRVGLVDSADLETDPEAALDRLLRDGCRVVLFDTVTQAHLASIGRLVWQQALREPLFAVGSSGLEYALTAHWREEGLLPPAPELKAGAVAQIAVASGSCSPVTARQIDWAVEHGFAEIPLRTQVLDDGEIERVVEEAVAEVGKGRSVIVHSSRGPDDPRVAATRSALSGADSAEVLGQALGHILRRVMEETDLRRAATTGGDSSLHMARALGVRSLEVLAPCAPGSPLCRVNPDDPAGGREIVFKGGQVGTVDFFGRVRRGSGEES